MVDGTGSTCEMGFWVEEAGPDGEPLHQAYSEAEKQHAVEVARRFIARLDVGSIDRKAAIRDWRRQESAAIAQEPPGEKQPRLHGDDLEITAVGAVVWKRLDDYLAGQHIPGELVVRSQGWRCDK